MCVCYELQGKLDTAQAKQNSLLVDSSPTGITKNLMALDDFKLQMKQMLDLIVARMGSMLKWDQG